MLPVHSFDNAKATRLIALGYPLETILPEFEPLISLVIRRNVSYDTRNIDEDDLKQIGRLQVKAICKDFNPRKASLFVYASTAFRHAFWSACKLGAADFARTPEEVDLDAQPSVQYVDHQPQSLKIEPELLESLRVGNDTKVIAACEFIYGIFCSGLYADNKSRVLKTLTYGLDLNPKLARYLVDQLLIQLRVKHESRRVKEVREDAFFRNKFKHTVVPELRTLLGERAFERLVHFFGGLAFTVPDHDQISSIDRDLDVVKSLSRDWTLSSALSKKYGVSTEGIKTVFKSNLHRLHMDEEYRALVAELVDLTTIPGYCDPKDPSVKPKVVVDGASRKRLHKKMLNTDSMGFQLGCRNSLMYTMIVTGRATRQTLVETVHMKFGGSLTSAKSTVSAFLSDIKHPFGKFNTSRALTLLIDSERRISFEKASLETAQHVIAERRKANLEAMS